MLDLRCGRAPARAGKPSVLRLSVSSPAATALRVEEVAVQTWEDGLIVEERFYYEGMVDEGDESAEGQSDTTIEPSLSSRSTR